MAISLKINTRALLCALLLSPSLALAQDRVADVEAFEGEVKLNPSRDPKLSLAPALGEDVFLNDVVTTFSKAKTRLRFIDKSMISLGENSRLRITRLVFDPDKNRDAELELQTGLALFMVGKALFGSYFQVLTPFGTFRAKGTVFTVEVFSDRAKLSVLEGVVEYINASGAIVSVSAGQSLEVVSSASVPASKLPTPAALPVGEEGRLLTAVSATTTTLIPAVTQLSLVEKTLSLPLTAPVGELLKAPLLKSTTTTVASTTNILQQTVLQPTLGLDLGLSSLLSVDNTANLTRVVGSIVLIP